MFFQIDRSNSFAKLLFFSLLHNIFEHVCERQQFTYMNIQKKKMKKSQKCQKNVFRRKLSNQQNNVRRCHENDFKCSNSFC